MSSTLNVSPMDAAIDAAFGLPIRIDDYIEKRRHTRLRMRLRTEARRMDNTLIAMRNPKLSLTLRDLSEGGLSATSRSPVEVGERLLVTLPPDSPIRARRIYGKVIRCTPSRDGWALAIRFDLCPAA